MSETTIRARDGMVVYVLPPDIAGSLAEVLIHEATHFRSGEGRPIHRIDRGWMDDAIRIAELSDVLLSNEDAEAI